MITGKLHEKKTLMKTETYLGNYMMQQKRKVMKDQSKIKEIVEEESTYCTYFYSTMEW